MYAICPHRCPLVHLMNVICCQKNRIPTNATPINPGQWAHFPVPGMGSYIIVSVIWYMSKSYVCPNDMLIVRHPKLSAAPIQAHTKAGVCRVITKCRPPGAPCAFNETLVLSNSYKGFPRKLCAARAGHVLRSSSIT